MLGVLLADDMAGPPRNDVVWARHSVAAEACVPRSTRAPQVWRGQRSGGVDAQVLEAHGPATVGLGWLAGQVQRPGRNRKRRSDAGAKDSRSWRVLRARREGE
jgi:hypothetical protein